VGEDPLLIALRSFSRTGAFLRAAHVEIDNLLSDLLCSEAILWNII
jgi:hypothetical protein